MTVKNRRKRQDINRRRQYISRLKQEGVKTQKEMIERLASDFNMEVSQATVSLDLKALDKQWIKASISNIDKWKRELIKQYQFIYEQSIAAWHLSLENAEEYIIDSEGNRTKKVKGQSGNPAYFTQAQNALKNIREIIGVDEALKISWEQTLPDGYAPSEVARQFAALMEQAKSNASDD